MKIITLFILSFASSLIAVEPKQNVTTAGARTVVPEQSKQRLSDGWEFYQGSLGSTWEVWRGDAASDNVAWSAVTLPHCFNGRDAVDPDARYYQGPGWYRTRLKVANPFPNEIGRAHV